MLSFSHDWTSHVISFYADLCKTALKTVTMMTGFECIPALMPVHHPLHAAFLCIHAMKTIRLNHQCGHILKVKKEEGS